MKVLIYASPANSQYDEYINGMYDEVKKLGYDHVNDEVKTHKIRDILNAASAGQKYSQEEYNQSITTLVDDINKAEICIFEVSFQSLGAGYLVDKSLDYSKPTIVLYLEGHKPHILSVVDDEKLVVRSYNEKNYKKVLKEALNFAREKRDKRFNFFLSPKLLNYLEQASNSRGITKSKLLRDMIVHHMRENSDTKE